MVPLCWLGVAIFAATCLAKSVSADSFESQFSSPIYYGLAVAGISLAAAVGAALFGLLIFCLVQRRRKEERKLAKSDTEASTMSSQQQLQQQQHQKAKQLQTYGVSGVNGGGATMSFGPMALPSAAAATINSAGSNGKAAPSTSSAGGASDSRTSLDAAGGRAHRGDPGQAPAIAAAAAPVGGSGSGGNGLYRHSSFLRPVSYASLESNKSRGSGGGLDHHPHHQQQQQQPVITHAVVRTSPATTLDPRYFLSQGAGINHQQDPSKRLSMAEQLPQLAHQQQQQQQQQQHFKRLSYAEQRAQHGSEGGSAVELVSGQVFASSSSFQRPALSTQPHNQQQQKPLARFPSHAAAKPALPPQPEDAAAASEAPAEGPRFPKPITSRPQPQQQALESPQRPHQSLRRIQLGGGGGEDGRSVASTVLKQEAMKAFDFLEGYDEDAN